MARPMSGRRPHPWTWWRTIGTPVDAAAARPRTPATDECVWTLNAGPDDLLVTILGTYELRGDASASVLSVRDPNDNLLVFGRDPAERGPVDPTPSRQHR